jgi:23S rRNA (uridine2552-2'-O)-methyltransferase
MSGDEVELKRHLRKIFQQVIVEKPQASRQDSSENYLVCLGWKGHQV